MTERPIDPRTGDATREFLRHTIATLAYRAAKALRDFPPAAFETRLSPASRTPREIVGHLGDLIEWAESLARGASRWEPAPAASWDESCDRFFRALGAFDAAVAEAVPESRPLGAIFQGPVADALTHVGQLALVRGLAGAPVRPESFARADIRAGRVSRDQPAPRAEFDGDASRPG